MQIPLIDEVEIEDVNRAILAIIQEMERLAARIEKLEARQ